MARITVQRTDGQERLLMVPGRCVQMLALMQGAISKSDAGRARALEVAGLLHLDTLRGTLAAHAVALSAMAVATEILSLPRESFTHTIELDYVCELAGAIDQLWESLHVVALDAFSGVGLPQSLPDPVGGCDSAHLAVRAVFSDMRDRVVPIFQEHGLVVAGQPWEAVAQPLRDRAGQLLETVLERLEPHYDQSLVRRWSGWRTVERVLVAEVAGAADAGVIRTDEGDPIDRVRFAAAIDAALRVQREDERQYLFNRWRVILQIVRHLRLRDGDLLPSLNTERRQLSALFTLTTDVLQDAQDTKQDTPALFELLEVLREMQGLQVREERILARHQVPDWDRDFAARLTKLLGETLPRVLGAAATEVDRLSLIPLPRQASDPATGQAGRAKGRSTGDDAPPAAARTARTRGERQTRKRAKMGAVDKALVRLLFQDLAANWKLGILHMNRKDLAQQLRGNRRRAPSSGSLRPRRIPHFLLFREFFLQSPKGKPFALIRDLPDDQLRGDLEQYATEAAAEDDK